MNFNYVEILRNNFRERGLRNPSYSLRAYARDLKVSSTALSDVMAGKRNFSEDNAKRIAENLSFSPEEYKQTILQIKNKNNDRKFQTEVIQIAEDEFNTISRWYYLAILTLSQQKNIGASKKNIAKRLGIQEHQVEEALDALERLGLLKVVDKKLKRTSHPLRIKTDIPSYAIRNYHKENLEVAKFSLDHTPIDLREISSMNLNIDPKKIQTAKALIHNFKENFTREMEKTDAKEVYTLSMHFFPATLNEDK